MQSIKRASDSQEQLTLVTAGYRSVLESVSDKIAPVNPPEVARAGVQIEGWAPMQGRAVPFGTDAFLFQQDISKATMTSDASAPSILGGPVDQPPAAKTAPGQAGGSYTLLVQFSLDATPAQMQAAVGTAGGRIIETVRPAGGVGGDLVLIEVGSAYAAEAVIAALERSPVITFAEQNWAVGVQFTPTDPTYTGGSLWGLYGDESSPSNPYGSQAGDAFATGATGSTKVVVGVIDTGVDYTHPDLYLNIWLNQDEIPTTFRTSLIDIDGDGLISFRDLNHSDNAAYVRDFNGNLRIDAGDLLMDIRWEDGIDQDTNGYLDDLIGWDFVNNDNDPYDDNGHGTHVAGTIGATTDTTGVIGISPDVQIMALKFLSGSGSGSTAGAIQAVDYYTAASGSPSTMDAFVATNNSWGGGGYSQALYDSIVQGALEDILFVAAAGNNTSNTDATANYPSNYSTLLDAGYEAVISVASITSTGGLSSFSNYGATTVDLGAPGSSIISTVPGGGYANYSGTSMAAPHVTGALALLAGENLDLSASDLRDALLSTAVATTSLSGKTVTGGRLNVDAMLDLYATPSPAFSISAGQSRVLEGAQGTTTEVTFTVRLLAPQVTAATVSWTATSSGVNAATLPGDVSGTFVGTLNFAPGTMSQTVTLIITGDNVYEPDEQFTVTLSDPSDGLTLANVSATVVIVNDDDDFPNAIAGAGTVSVSGTGATGVVDFSGDKDAFAVSLTAGVTYIFAQKSTTGLDSLLTLSDTSLTALATNDDANGTLDSQITYTPTVSGTYYLIAGGYGSSIGAYTVSAKANTVLTGTASADTLNGSALNDTIDGLDGNDILNGNAGNDIIFGGAGNDTIDGGSGNDSLTGGAGIDTASYASLTGAVAVSLAIAGAQNTGTGGTDTLTQIENLTGGSGNDTLTGDGNPNRIDGGAGDDTIDGGGGSDVLLGGAGIDTLSYALASGAITVSLGLTKAQITGGAGTDTVSAFENLIGSAYADKLTGDASANVISGGNGADVITGGTGRDVLAGGAGADTFDFNFTTDSGTTEATADIILDFVQGDKIDLSGIDASAKLRGNNAFLWIDTATIGTSSAGELRYQQFDAGTNAPYTLIYGDTDQDTAAEFVIRVNGLLTFSETDFLF